MVEASTEFGCSVILEFEYGADPFTEPEINLSSFLCDNQVSGVFTAPSGYGSYLWSNGETSATATFGGLNTVSEISVQLSNGPTCDTTIVIPIEPSSVVVEPVQTIQVSFCAESESVQLTAPSSYVGYQWPDFSATSQYEYLNPSVGTTVQLWATPNNSVCPNLIEYELSSSIPANPDAFIEVPVCLLQNSVALNRPSTMVSGEWEFNNSNSAMVSFPNPVYGDTVFIHGADNSSFNCPLSTGFVFVKKTPLLPDSLSKTVFACIQKDTITLEAEHPFDQHSWQPGGQTDSSIQIINPEQGDVFNLDAVGTDDCPYFRSFEIVGFPLPDSTVVMGPFCETTARILLIGPPINSNYVWLNEGTLFSSGSPTAWLNDPESGAEITVEFTDTLGCRNTFKYTLTLNTQQTSVLLNHTDVPNVFSPAKVDGFNDVFLFPFSNYDTFDLQVFNRWGQPVFNFSGTNELIEWDGKKDGQTLPGGTYFYKLGLSACNSDEARNYEGTILLMAD
jgi:gliding motility-associated-like protein